MADIKMHEQLTHLRKQKGITQEELAQALGVTNQAVSKWESGACCPDISLIPEVASFFNVTIDRLFGQTNEVKSFMQVVNEVKGLFEKTSAADCFDLAYKLAFCLHEGACTKGYKGFVPWDMSKDRLSDEDYYQWGYSITSEPEGVTMMSGSTVLISSQRHHRELNGDEQMCIWSEIQKFADIDRLTVFLALYELTHEDFDCFATIQTLAEKTGLCEEHIREAFKWLPIQHKRLCDGGFGYRIEGCHMHLPTLLRLFMRY